MWMRLGKFERYMLLFRLVKYSVLISKDNTANTHTNVSFIQVDKYVVIATIVSVQMDHDWYYLACRKCNKGVELETEPPVADGSDGSTFMT